MTTYNDFLKLVNDADDCNEEYQTKHDDAGDSYVHMVTEEIEQYRAKVAAYACELLNVNELTAELIAAEFDQWCVDMVAGHRFTGDIKGSMKLNGWAIEEIENQHELSRYAAELDCEISQIVEWVKKLDDDNDVCARYNRKGDTFETYRCTDGCWFATIDDAWFADTLIDLIDQDND